MTQIIWVFCFWKSQLLKGIIYYLCYVLTAQMPNGTKAFWESKMKMAMRLLYDRHQIWVIGWARGARVSIIIKGTKNIIRHFHRSAKAWLMKSGYQNRRAFLIINKGFVLRPTQWLSYVTPPPPSLSEGLLIPATYQSFFSVCSLRKKHRRLVSLGRDEWKISWDSTHTHTHTRPADSLNVTQNEGSWGILLRVSLGKIYNSARVL